LQLLDYIVLIIQRPNVAAGCWRRWRSSSNGKTTSTAVEKVNGDRDGSDTATAKGQSLTNL